MPEPATPQPSSIINRGIRAALNHGDIVTVLALAVADAADSSDQRLIDAVKLLSDEDRESLAWAIRHVYEDENGRPSVSRSGDGAQVEE
jgi:hypothetical protein